MNCMPIWKACNRQIDYLDRSHCNLIAVPDDILRYKTLEELFLDFNQLRDLPRTLYKLINLRKLSVSENEIVRLSADIGSLVHLEELNISQNDLQEIPDTIRLCKELTVLEVSNNPLQRLPEGLTQLTNLTRLGLSNVSLTRLPVDIGSLSALEQLELRDNSLKYLPATLCSLKNLKSLDLGSNALEDLPETIGGLSSLEELLLDNNELGYLPKEVGTLKKLNQLDVSNNKLDRLPNEIGGMASMTDLLLSENHLEYLPETIGNLKKLTILKADQNRILLLTSNIGSCHALQELILTENLLQELPITIGKLRNLVIVNADRNRLSHLPREIGSCSRLGVLSVRDNKLEVLPSEVGNLKVLHVLDVSGNRLRYLPMSLGTCNLKAIWLSENQAQPLLKFQQDLDSETNQKVLVCFLLPQQAALTQSTMNLMKLDKNIKPVADNRESWNGETHNRQSAIRFTEDLPKLEKESEGQFVRQNTPFPKDLRTRKPISKDGSTDPTHGRKSLEPADAVDSKPNGFIPNSNMRQKWWIPQQPPSVIENSGKPINNQNVTKEPQSNNKSFVKEAVKKIESDSSDDSDTDDEDEEEHEITIKFVRKAGVGLGISIAGGVGSNPYRDDDDGIFLSRVTEEGPSWKAGLRPGDKLLEVNGNSLLNADHHRAVEVLKEAGVSVTMVVLRIVKVQTPEIISTVLYRGTVGLGFSIAGGKGSPTGDEASHISKITEGGLAAQDGKLRAGDRLISINGVNVKDATHEQVVALLRESGNQIRLTVSRDPGVDNKSKSLPQNDGQKQRSASVNVPPSTLNYSSGSIRSNQGNRSDKSPAGVPINTSLNAINFEKVNNSVQNGSKDNSPASVKSPISKSTPNGNFAPRQDSADKWNAQRNGSVKSGRPQPSLDDSIPHMDDQSPVRTGRVSLSDDYRKPRESVPSKRQDASEGLDYQIPHIEGRVGLAEGEAYLDPVEGRTIHDIQLKPVSHRVNKDSSDMDKPVPHADDQVHFVKQKLSRMDADIPGADYQMNYVTKESAPQRQPSALSSSHVVSHPVARMELGPVLQPPVSVARIPSSPVVMMKVPKPDKMSNSVEQSDQKKTSNNNNNTVTPSRGRTLSKSSTHEPAGRGNESNGNSAVDALFSSLDRSYDGERGHRSSSRRAKPPSVSSRSSSVPPKDLNSSVNGNTVKSKPSYPIEKVTVQKAGGPLGLSIVGGVDHISYPFGVDEPGVFISKIIPKGAASRSTLRVGDRILSVNGKNIRKASHQEAVAALSAQSNEVILEVRRDPQPPGLLEITMTKLPNEKLGLSIRGGSGNQAGNPLDESDDGIFISKINAAGTVARDGRLSAGMRILDVNGRSLLGCSHHEAVEVLRSVADRLTITVCDGYDPSYLSIASTSPSLSGSFRNARFNSLSSIDRDFDDSGIGGKNKTRKGVYVESSEDEGRATGRRKPQVGTKPKKNRSGSTTSILASNDQLNVSYGSVPGDIGGSLDDVRGKKRTKSSKTRSKANTGDSLDTSSARKKKSTKSSSSVTNISASSRDAAPAMIFQRPT